MQSKVHSILLLLSLSVLYGIALPSFSPNGQRTNLLTDPDMQEFRDRFFRLGGFLLVPLLLSTRYDGYGYLIDQGIAWVNEKLSELNKPEMREQLAQQFAQYALHQEMGGAAPL